VKSKLSDSSPLAIPVGHPERPEAQTPYLDQIFEPVEGVLSEGQSNNGVRDDHDARFLTRMVVGMLNIAVTHWLADPSCPIERELPRAARFAWHAARAQHTPA
jgi:hypothetical protein